jgi:hypothetical protein
MCEMKPVRRPKVIKNRLKSRAANARAAMLRRGSIVLGVALTWATRAFAQGNSPWENAVNVLQLTFAFGEGGGKRTFAGLVFGLGMAVLAVNFLSWLFGV